MLRKRKPTDALALSFPVFYDHSGKRLRRIIVVSVAVVLVVAGVGVWLIPAALRPTWTTKDDSGYARRVLTGLGTLPVVGDAENGVLTRIVRVVREHPGSGRPPGPPPEETAPPEENDPADDTTPVAASGDAAPLAGQADEQQSDPTDPPPMPRVMLTDAITGEYIRDATENEVEQIGDSNYATEHFGQVSDHTLILTFDDGPDPQWTPAILDVLAQEGVPATFFVIGRNIVKYPELFRREIREGHMAGNHTLSHLNFDRQDDWRNQEEITATDRIMRAVANYASPIFRIPTGDPDHNELAQLESQQLGYQQIDMDLDTDDWSYQPGEEVPVPDLDGNGHVVLMHDGGGNRQASIDMLRQLIANAKDQGYVFATVDSILPPRYQPQTDITPGLADKVTLAVADTLWVAPSKLLGVLFWFGTGSLVIFSTLYLLLALLNEWRQRRRCWPDIPDDKLPCVSVVLAAYNEEKVIARTLDVLRESDYPADRIEVVAVNDGSSDGTAAILDAYDWDRLTVVHQPNSGKSSALNNGINHAHPDSTVIVTLDADTLFRKNTIRMLVRHFAYGHGRLGAVAGHVKVGNRRNIVTAWQSLEYISGICVTRMAEMTMSAISIVPGACSAWRREALEKIGGFNDTTLAEDADATLTLQRLGYAVVNENAAICDTEGPRDSAHSGQTA